MYPTEEGETASGNPRQRSDAELLHRTSGFLETREYCAYNRTRECFLALDVADADIQYADLDSLTRTLTFDSGDGLWIVPFRGIPATGTGIPLDLVFLDEECRVIELEESFLTYRHAPSNQRAASVLALARHTIYSSQTQIGDQLVICKAGETWPCLEQLSSSGGPADPAPDAVLLSETQFSIRGAALSEQADNAKAECSNSGHPNEIGIINPGKRNFKPRKGWLERWLSPDPRKGERMPVAGLEAYYFTGATPVARSVRDISSTGLYLVTEERWYPGTVVLMTLQRTDCGEERHDRSIYVHSKAVRWGADGVGLKFIFPEAQQPSREQNLLVDSVDKKGLDRFLERFLTSKI